MMTRAADEISALWVVLHGEPPAIVADVSLLTKVLVETLPSAPVTVLPRRLNADDSAEDPPQL